MCNSRPSEHHWCARLLPSSCVLGALGALVALSSCGADRTGSSSGVSETTVAEQPAAIETSIETTVESSVSSESTTPTEFIHLAGAINVGFDAARNEPRPLKETLVPVVSDTDVLAMKISGFSYRGVICGFSLTGEAPPSSLTIRQFVRTPAGTFDSGPIDVSWTSLADENVKAGTSQSGTWNFNAEAHVNRSGPGWVVSIGGVTPPIGGDEKEAIPTDGGCELRSTKKVFTSKVGPVGYWAGFAVT
jgi:hypothetical protein